MPLQVSRDATAWAMRPAGSTASSAAIRSHGCPTRAAVRGPTASGNSGEPKVNCPSASICQTKRKCRRPAPRPAAAGWMSASRSPSPSAVSATASIRSSGVASSTMVGVTSAAEAASWSGSRAVTSAGGGGSAAGAACSIHVASRTVSAPPPIRSIVSVPPATSWLARPRDSASAASGSVPSDARSPASPASAVVWMSVPSEENTASGVSQAANARRARSASDSLAAPGSVATTRTAKLPSASASHEQAQASGRPIEAIPRRRSSRGVPVFGRVAASREICARSGSPGENRRAASAAGLSASAAAPAALAHRICAPSAAHSHTGRALTTCGASVELRRRARYGSASIIGPFGPAGRAAAGAPPGW